MANELLRARRRATPSPSGSGKPMTQAELAEAVNQYVWTATGRQIDLDVDTLSRYERGMIRWPGTDYRDGLRAVLGVDSDADLGFFPTRRGRAAESRAHGALSPLPRRDFMMALATAGIAASVDALSRDLDLLAPAQVVTEADLERLKALGQFYTSWAHVNGGQAIGQSVAAEMTRAVGLLKLACPARLRKDLMASIGQFGVVTGSLLFDAHQYPMSERLLAFATTCAEESGDWHLRAKALSWRARQAVWTGQLTSGLEFAQLGLVESGRLTPTERAMLHTAVARAHGRLGDAQATIRAIGAADEAFADADPTNDVPWMAYYDHSQHAGDTGHALFELAATRSVYVAETRNRLTIAVEGHSDDYIRSRSFSGFKLAALTMAVGDPHEGAAIAQSAVRDAAGIRSQRLRRTALEIRPLAAPHSKTDEVGGMLQLLAKVGTAA